MTIGILAIMLFCIAAFLELFEVRPQSFRVRLRKNNISALISGTIFGLLGLIALLVTVLKGG